MFATPTFTIFHVALSLVGIGAGFVVLGGLLADSRLDGWTALLLASTVATSMTGFLFPFHGFLPSHGVGIVSLLVLPVALYAHYAGHLAGAWRWVYVVTAVLAPYLNFFVGVVQAFEKVPALYALAPTQAEPPFVFTQLGVLALIAILAIAAGMRLHPVGRAGSRRELHDQKAC